MATSETQRELLQHLDKVTREMNPSNMDVFTTAKIAQDLNISRNLASQYLNDCVRDGLVVKVNSRPVVFFFKRALERYIQHNLDSCEYALMKEHFDSAGIHESQDFEHAIGFDNSLSACVAQLKAAVRYPPYGLPALLVGERGTGKSLLARLSFEYGRNRGTLPPESHYVALDCSLYVDDDQAFACKLFGSQDETGLVERVCGGIVLLNGFDLLSRGSQKRVMTYIRSGEQFDMNKSVAPARFMFSVVAADSSMVDRASHIAPIVVNVPSLGDRTVGERTEIILHFLRVEGRRVAADVSISRGALRTLIESDFDDNIDGLRNCITNCCAKAYLNPDDERLVIRTYNLPSAVLGSSVVQADDDKLMSCDKEQGGGEDGNRFQVLLREMLNAFRSFEEGRASLDDFESAATLDMHSFQDLLNFENQVGGARVTSYEHVLNPDFESINSSYGIELTRKSSRMLAQLLCMQLWGGSTLDEWKKDNGSALQSMVEVLRQSTDLVPVVIDQIENETRTALGHEFDAITWILLFLDAKESAVASHGRTGMGIILCHGYSTATSIADAANRILRTRVFEAIDMTYDQQINDVFGPLTRLIGRYSFCNSIVLLVDTGSLSGVYKALSGATNADIYVVDNVSTGLALELGSDIANNRDITATLDACAVTCAPHHQVVEGRGGDSTILFCSENGIEAANSIRKLVENSLPRETEVRLVTTDFRDLLRDGKSSPVFERCNVRAIVGTVDPEVEGVPFVGLEDILYAGSSNELDRVFSRDLGVEGMVAFHESIVKNLTLQNVIESITILNPEKLYSEAEQALGKLQDFSGERIDSRVVIGLYVHICALIERLITKTPIESYPEEDVFAQEHGDFVRWFRKSFDDLMHHYKVTVPISEIAYVYDFIHGKYAFRQKTPLGTTSPEMRDE